MMDALETRSQTSGTARTYPAYTREASQVVKQQGGENDLLGQTADDPIFGVTLEELKETVKPESMWDGPLYRQRIFCGFSRTDTGKYRFVGRKAR